MPILNIDNATATMPHNPVDLEAQRNFAERSQQFVEQSIKRYPGYSVSAALAAGVLLGCLFKRN